MKRGRPREQAHHGQQPSRVVCFSSRREAFTADQGPVCLAPGGKPPQLIQTHFMLCCIHTHTHTRTSQTRAPGLVKVNCCGICECVAEAPDRLVSYRRVERERPFFRRSRGGKIAHGVAEALPCERVGLWVALGACNDDETRCVPRCKPHFRDGVAAQHGGACARPPILACPPNSETMRQRRLLDPQNN